MDTLPPLESRDKRQELIERADRAYAETHYAKAGRLYLASLAIRRDDTHVLLRLGKIREAQGLPIEACGFLSAALALDGELAEAANNLAWLLATASPAVQRDGERAVALAERACGLTDHRNPAYLDTLAAAYAAAGRFREAARTAARAQELAEAAREYRALAAGIGERRALFAAGQPLPEKGAAKQDVERRSGAPEDRREAVEDVIGTLESLNSGNELVERLAWILSTHPDCRVRDGSAAIRLAEVAVQGSGGARALDVLAAAYAQAGQFERACETAAQALRVATQRGRAQAVGQIQRRLRSYEQGLPYRQTAGGMVPQIGSSFAAGSAEGLSFALYLLAGSVRAEGGAAERVRPLLERAIRLDPASRLAHLELAALLFENGEPERAIDTLREAHRLAAGDATTLLHLGLALLSQRRPEEAIAYFELAQDLERDSAATAAHLAWALATAEPPHLREPGRAVRLAERSVSLDGRRSAKYLDILAAAYAADEQFEAAVEIATEAREIAAAETAGSLAESIEARRRLYEHRVPYRGPHAVQIDEGLWLLQHGFTRAAEEKFRRALKAAPHDPRALYAAALAAERGGDVEGALRDYGAALRIDSQFADAADRLARLMLADEGLRQANGLLILQLAHRACRASDYRDLDRTEMLARACGEVGLFDEAATIAEWSADVARAAGDSDWQRRFERQLRAYREGERIGWFEAEIASDGDSGRPPMEPAAAVRHFGRYVSSQLNRANGSQRAVSLAWSLATHDDPRARLPQIAIRILRMLGNPGDFRDAGLLDTHAAALAASGDYKAAAHVAEQAVRSAKESNQPEQAAAIRQRLVRYRGGSMYTEAAGASFQAGSQENRAATARALACALDRLGDSLLAQGDEPAARQALECAARIDPMFRPVRCRLGRIHLAQGRLEEAARCFLIALDGDARDAETLRLLGSVRELQGRGGEAVDLFEASLALKPDSREALNNLAWILATDPHDEVRSSEGALRAARRACEGSGAGNAGYLDTLAAAYASAGRFEEAVSTVEEALGLLPPGENEDFRQAMVERRELYASGKAYRVGVREKD